MAMTSNLTDAQKRSIIKFITAAGQYQAIRDNHITTMRPVGNIATSHEKDVEEFVQDCRNELLWNVDPKMQT